MAKLQFSADLILNADETSWKIINNRHVTIAKRGMESVTCEFNCSEKESITVMAAITKSGKKLPLWIFVDGKTKKSTEKFKNQKIQKYINNSSLFITYSETGWCTKDLAIEYLKWINERFNDNHTFLIWDVYPVHKSNEVINQAIESNVHLSFVPPGMTDVWQPLDYSVFGSLKSRAKARFDSLISKNLIQGNEQKISWPDIIDILVSIWSQFPEEEILEAWKCLD